MQKKGILISGLFLLFGVEGCTAVKTGSSRAADTKPFKTSLDTSYPQSNGECSLSQISSVLNKWGTSALNECKNEGFQNCRLESMHFGSAVNISPKESDKNSPKDLCQLQVIVAGAPEPANSNFPSSKIQSNWNPPPIFPHPRDSMNESEMNSGGISDIDLKSL